MEREVYGGRAAESAGVTPEAMAQEVKREYQRRMKAAQKQQERRDLTPAAQLQPKAYGIRYPNMRSGRAEEGVLRLMPPAAGLFREAGTLTPEQFSVPVSGPGIRDMLRERFEQGRIPSFPPWPGS